MEKKTVAIGSPVQVNGFTLIAITELSMNYWYDTHNISFSGVKRPIAVVLITPSAKKVFRITGEEIRLEQLILEIPDIKEIVERV